MRRAARSILVAIACVGLLSSCAISHITQGTYEQRAETQLRRICDAVEDKNSAALAKIFSNAAGSNAPDLDSGIEYFLSVFPAGRLTWKSQGTDSGWDSQDGKVIQALFGYFLISVDGSKFELYFTYVTQDDYDPKNVGIYSLGVTPLVAKGSNIGGVPKPFLVWRGSFDIRDHAVVGRPGIYVPQN